MRPLKIVFNQPFSQVPVEDSRVGMEVAQIDKFLLDRPVKSLIVWIVFGRPHPGIVLFDLEFLASQFETLLKLAAVIVPHPKHLAIQEEV